jgi:hypothetical protein
MWRMVVTLDEVTPAVWRSLLVQPDIKLAKLHRYLQVAMGWDEMHLFEFRINRRVYGIPDPELRVKMYDARRYALNRLIREPAGTFTYHYDFGDNWTHTIRLGGAELAVPRARYPVCTDGRGPCPPEDCGGVPGYERLLSVLRDPDDPEHEELRTWAAMQHYPRRFSARAATSEMRDIERGWR